MTVLSKIRQSFTTQLSLWVAGFVLVISGLVIYLLAWFSQGVIHDETIDTTMQVLENTALRIDNSLRQSEMTARLERQQMEVNGSRIEHLLEENRALDKFKASLPNAQYYVTHRDSSQFQAIVTGAEGGYSQIVHEGKEMYVFLQPVGNRPYTIAVVSPATDIYSRFSRMQWILSSWGIGAILFLLVILYNVIGRHLRPLHNLADTAQAISQGALDMPIARSHHHDETGRLQNSLSKMQRRLAANMEEMQQKQATLSRQNAELKAAYDEAEAYEARKAAILHDLTDSMGEPVEILCRRTETICQYYSKLTKQDMTDLQSDIMKSSETITKLLDKLIKDRTST